MMDMVFSPVNEGSAGRGGGATRSMRCLAVVDGTETTNRVVDFVLRLCEGRDHAEVVVINVQQRSANARLRGYDNFMRQEVEDRLITDVGYPIVRSVSNWLQKAGVNATAKVKVGDPLALILQCAAAENCDAIVVGATPASAGLSARIFGGLGLCTGLSVIARLIARSSVPVVVVR